MALTSCLCKVPERMINTCFICYPAKYGILDKSQCGFRKHCSTMDHLVSLEKYVWDAFARKQQQLISSLICRKPMRLLGNMVLSVTYIGLGSEADCLFLWVSHGLPKSSLRKDHTLTNFIQKKEYQLVVSWLLHALEYRLSCPLILPWTSSEHSLLMTWLSAFVGAPSIP